MSFFQTSKNLKLEGGFGDLQEALHIVNVAILQLEMLITTEPLANFNLKSSINQHRFQNWS